MVTYKKLLHTVATEKPHQMTEHREGFEADYFIKNKSANTVYVSSSPDGDSDESVDIAPGGWKCDDRCEQNLWVFASGDNSEVRIEVEYHKKEPST